MFGVKFIKCQISCCHFISLSQVSDNHIQPKSYIYYWQICRISEFSCSPISVSTRKIPYQWGPNIKYLIVESEAKIGHGKVFRTCQMFNFVSKNTYSATSIRSLELHISYRLSLCFPCECQMVYWLVYQYISARLGHNIRSCGHMDSW